MVLADVLTAKYRKTLRILAASLEACYDMLYNMTDNIQCTIESHVPGVYHVYFFYQSDKLTNRFEVQIDEDFYNLYYHNEYESDPALRKTHIVKRVYKVFFEKKLLRLIRDNKIQTPIVATNKLNDPLPEAFWIWYLQQTFFKI